MSGAHATYLIRVFLTLFVIFAVTMSFRARRQNRDEAIFLAWAAMLDALLLALVWTVAP